LRVFLDNIIEKMEEIIIQWTDFENEFDEITTWFRLIESFMKDQQLQSTFDSKENKLNLFAEKRNEILNYEPKIEKFTDNSNNLLHTSGVERLKPLILQVGNR
jgi:nesprin-1